MFVVPNRYRHKLQMVDSIFICIIIKTGRRKRSYIIFLLCHRFADLSRKRKNCLKTSYGLGLPQTNYQCSKAHK